jgi:hypothetical protein
VVVGVSERWEEEGLGATRLALARLGETPVLVVRRGLLARELSGIAELSRYTWSCGEEPG